MLTKSYIISCFVILSLASCGQHLYQGVYQRSGTTEEFKIKSDSTFEYSVKAGVNKAYSSGKWFKGNDKNNVLLLRSFYQKDSFPLFVKESTDSQINGFEVRLQKFYTRQKDTSVWMALIVNEDVTIEVGGNTIKIPGSISAVKKLQLVIYSNNFFKPDLTPVNEYTKQVKTETYAVINTNANVFSFTYPDVDANMFYYKYFSNDKIVITGKKLSWPSENSVFVMK